MARMKTVAPASVETKRQAPTSTHIIWDNGVPKRIGNPFPIWNDLPDPLVPLSPATASVDHPWSAARLQAAAKSTLLRYKTLCEVIQHSNKHKKVSADHLLWHEERAATRARNTLIAHREWHRKLPSAKSTQYAPMYAELLQQYRNHLDNHRRLTIAFCMLKRWIAKSRAARALYPKPIAPSPSRSKYLQPNANLFVHLIRTSTMHTLAMSGIRKQIFLEDHSSRQLEKTIQQA